MMLKKLTDKGIKSSWARAGGLFCLALTMGLVAGCREVPGSCSQATNNLCLSFQLADPAIVPATLRLSMSALDHPTRTEDFNADPVLAERAYILEVAISDSGVTSIDLDCDGLLPTAQAPAGEVVVRGSKSVNLATADRPTVIILSPSNSTVDMATPVDVDMRDPAPVMDMRTPGDMRMPPGDGMLPPSDLGLLKAGS